MKIIMMRPSYKPELSGGTHLAIDLVKDFLIKGHTVNVITPISPKYINLVDESLDECKVYRIYSKHNKKNVFSRILRYIDTSFKMYKTALHIDADVIITHSMPPLLGPMGTRLSKKKKIPVVYWEQDVVSQSIITTGIFNKNKLLKKIAFKFAESLEKKSEKNSDYIITISEKFKKMHIERGVSPEKISVIYNWIDTNQIYPVSRDNNSLFDELNIPKNKFIVTYCGNLGVPQNVEIMIDAAELLKDNNNIFFVIIGGGSREEYIKKYLTEKKLDNIKLFPLQPLEKAHLVYSIGDVGLVIGKSGTSKNGFPSKTWSIMSAGQAMIACFDLDSELSNFVKNSNCGIVVEPDSSDKLASAIEHLFINKKETRQMGLNARKYVKENFSREQSTQKFLKLVSNQVERRVNK